MPISSENTKMLIVIPKELKKDFEELAKNENRSLSQQVVYLIRKELGKIKE